MGWTYVLGMAHTHGLSWRALDAHRQSHWTAKSAAGDWWVAVRVVVDDLVHD